MDASLFTIEIFRQAIGSAFVLPFTSNITLQAMKEFGGYVLHQPAYIAALGMVIACLLNWVIGYGVRLLRNNVGFLGKNPYDKAAQFMHKYGYLFIALFWLPLGPLILVVNGFFRVPVWKVIVLSVIGSFYTLRTYFV